VSAECAGTRVFSVYVPNGRALDNEMYEVKLAWLARLRATLDQTCPPGSSVAVCGDFNVAPDDGDVWDPAAFMGATHVSVPERKALQKVEGWGLDDVFRRFNDPGTFTWWDYRAGDFHQGRGLRIDLVLVSDDLVQRATGAFRDRDARKGQKPSDHAPVVVDFADN
jgi:exodeoxyribonuclease-3